MTRHTRGRAAVVALIGLTSVVTACGDEDETTTTTATPTTGIPTTAAPTTEAAISTTGAPTTEASTTTTVGTTDIGVLNALLQALLTTDEIGGGWTDQGRTIIPPGSEQRTGFLCADGQELADPLGSSFDPMVGTWFALDGARTPSIGESLLLGPRETIEANFATWSAAVDACSGSAYETDELGAVRLDPIETPDFGEVAADVVAFHVGPSQAQAANPWMEFDAVEVLVVDPSSEMAGTMTINVTAVHDPPDLEIAPVDREELFRVVGAALAKLASRSEE